MVAAERILIVGGGIAGLASAIALRRAGYAAQLVERSSSWPAVGAGIALHANAGRGLRALGLGEPVERAASALRRWTFADASGALLCETDLEALWAGVGPCLGITRTRLQQLLVEAIHDVPCRLGVEVTGLTDAEPSIAVRFSDGARAEFDLVVGADGIRSTVRRLGLGEIEPSYAATMAWRSVVDARPEGLDGIAMFMGDGRFFGLVPVDERGTYGFAGIASERFHDPLDGRLERLRARFAGFAAPVLAFLDAIESDAQIHAGPLEAVEASRWHAGRVVLVGDAAHAATPHMGQGGAMAIEDALALAQALQSATTLQEALAGYDARRRPRVEWVQQQSRAAAGAWVLPAHVRDQVLRERGDAMLQARYSALAAPA